MKVSMVDFNPLIEQRACTKLQFAEHRDPSSASMLGCRLQHASVRVSGS
jgi:hypothetical protein